MSLYSVSSQIHSLSEIANAAFDLKETSLSGLQSLTTQIVTQTLADAQVQSYISADWELLWGPVVYSNNANPSVVPNAPLTDVVVADNTMMLLYNTSISQFVIAIAGTNAVSMYGIFQEDFQVSSLVDWNTIAPGNGATGDPGISAGSNIGLNVLLSMTGTYTNPKTSVATSGVTVQKALNLHAATITGTATLAVAGHSLGGALTLVLATYINDTMSQWNIAKIDTYATAAPSPGNADFATHASNVLTRVISSTESNTLTSIYNTIDVVPQAWNQSSMELVPTLYSSGIPNPRPTLTSPPTTDPKGYLIGLLVYGIFLNTYDKTKTIPGFIDYEPVGDRTQSIGSFSTDIDLKAEAKLAEIATIYATDSETSLKQFSPYFGYIFRFLEQMLYQHIAAYNAILGDSEVAARLAAIKQSIIGQSADERIGALRSIALGKYYGWRFLE